MTFIDLTRRITGVHAVRIKFAQKDTPNHPLILVFNDSTGSVDISSFLTTANRRIVVQLVSY